MARKPIQDELRGLQTPRERMWAGMLACMREKGWFTRLEIEDHAHPIDLTSVSDYLEALQRAQLVEQIAEPKSRGRERTPGRWRLKVTWPVAPRLNKAGVVVTQGLGVIAMWRVAKILKTFQPADLARDASVGEVQVKLATAKSYCKALSGSGHFEIVTPSKPGTQAVYRVARNTGPHAPAVTRTKCVFDRNTGDITPIQTAQEVLDANE